MSPEPDQREDNDAEQQMIALAVDYFREALKLAEEDAEMLIKPHIRMVHLKEGEILFEEGNTDGTALGMVMAGVLKVTQEPTLPDNLEFGEGEKEPWSIYIQTQELVGGLQVSCFILSKKKIKIKIFNQWRDEKKISERNEKKQKGHLFIFDHSEFRGEASGVTRGN